MKLSSYISENELSYKLHCSVEEISKEKWDLLQKSSSITHSYNFWKTVENSQFPKFENLKYIAYYDDIELLAIVPCYTIRTDMAIFSSWGFKKLLNIK